MPGETTFITGKDVLYNTRSWRKGIRDVLRRAYDAHCGLRLTKSQHVIVTSRASDGFNSTTVAASPHGLAQYKRDVDKVIASQRTWEAQHQQQAANDGRPLPTEPIVTGASAAPPKPTPPSVRTSDSRDQVIHCPACKPRDPGFVQLTQEALNEHLEAVHVRCPNPTCRQWVRSRNGLPGHKAIKHNGAQPWAFRENAVNPMPKDRPASPDSATAPVAPPITEVVVTPEAVEAGIERAREVGRQMAAAAVQDGPTPPQVLVPPDIAERAAAARTAPAAHAARKPRRVRGTPQETVPLPDVLPDSARPGRNDAIVREIRRIMGDDPQLAELRQQLQDMTGQRDAWRKRAEDAETRIAMMLGQLDQVRAAADL